MKKKILFLRIQIIIPCFPRLLEGLILSTSYVYTHYTLYTICFVQTHKFFFF